MKQKYTIIRDDERKVMMIREYAELDKEMMSLLCEEAYPQETVSEAAKTGDQAVINVLRTNNMYPPTPFAQAIAEAVKGLLADEGNTSAELFFDDRDLFNKDAEAYAVSVGEEEVELEADEDVEVDDLLDDAIDDDFEDDKVLKDLKSSIQIADDDTNELDDVS